MRSRFDEQLILLNKKMTQMGALCEELIAFVAKALLNGDIEGAREVKSRGQEIDHMEREIEAICLRLLLQQQPVAKDLRVVSAALKMITDMERIGDQAEDIADIIPLLNGRTGAEISDFKSMAEATCFPSMWVIRSPTSRPAARVASPRVSSKAATVTLPSSRAIPMICPPGIRLSAALTAWAGRSMHINKDNRIPAIDRLKVNPPFRLHSRC